MLKKLTLVSMLTVMAAMAAPLVDCPQVCSQQIIENQNLNPTIVVLPVFFYATDGGDETGTGLVAGPLYISTVITVAPPLDPAGSWQAEYWNQPYCPPSAHVPEPTTLAMIGMGLLFTALVRKSR